MSSQIMLISARAPEQLGEVKCQAGTWGGSRAICKCTPESCQVRSRSNLLSERCSESDPGIFQYSIFTNKAALCPWPCSFLELVPAQTLQAEWH